MSFPIYKYNLYIYIYQNDLHVIIYQLATVYGTGPSKQNGLGLEAGEGGVHIRNKGNDLTHLLRVEPPEMYKNSL